MLTQWRRKIAWGSTAKVVYPRKKHSFKWGAIFRIIKKFHGEISKEKRKTPESLKPFFEKKYFRQFGSSLGLFEAFLFEAEIRGVSKMLNEIVSDFIIADVAISDLF